MAQANMKIWKMYDEKSIKDFNALTEESIFKKNMFAEEIYCKFN
jgi:hypothetical protein